MKKLIRLMMFLSMGLFINACYYEAFPVDELEPVDETELVSYELDVIPLWAQCVGCHNGTVPPNFEDSVSYDELLNGYVVPGDADASILYKSLLGTDGVSLMPPGSSWPSAKIDLVRAWINQGALNN